MGTLTPKPQTTRELTLPLLLLLLLSCFSRVQLCATPKTAAHHAPPSLGFSRQEHWSGLPFPVSNTENSHKGNHLNTRPCITQPAVAPCAGPSIKQQTKQNTNPVISRHNYHLTQPCPSEEKQTYKQKLSMNLTLYETYTNHWTNLRREENKRRKEFNLETWEKETSIHSKFKK